MPTTLPHYCGIDVGSKSHRACVLDSNQSVIKQMTILNNREGLESLEKYLSEDTKICLEPTGIYSVNIFLYFKRKGYDIRFCTTNSSRDFRESLYGKKKHDKLDALGLAKYRVVHEQKTFDSIPLISSLSEDSADGSRPLVKLGLLLDDYHRLSRQTTILRTKITGLVDLRFPEARQVFPAKRSGATIMNLLLHSKEEILDGKITLNRLPELQSLVRRTIGQYEWKSHEFRNMVEELKEKISQTGILQEQMDVQITCLGYASLLEHPGLSTVSLATLLVGVRSANRFVKRNSDGTMNKKRSLKAFKAFCGLSTTSNQSGQHEGTHRIQKRGNLEIRNILYMMALSYLSKPKYKNIADPKGLSPAKYLRVYELKSAGKPKKVCIFKMMNKIAIDLFFLLLNAHQDQTPVVVSCSLSTPNTVPSPYATHRSQNVSQESV